MRNQLDQLQSVRFRRSGVEFYFVGVEFADQLMRLKATFMCFLSLPSAKSQLSTIS